MAPRKRVRAIQRAPDGSAFKKCDDCGVLILISLSDMHQCDEDSKPPPLLKKLKTTTKTTSHYNATASQLSISDQPRSPFRFFMESFAKARMNETDELEIDRKGFETWKAMTFDERSPYILEAEKVNSAYARRTQQEIVDFREEYDESDSGDFGSFTLSNENCEYPYSTECNAWRGLISGLRT